MSGRRPVGQHDAMTALISHTTIDCTDAYELSEWWKKVLGYVDLPDDPHNPGDEECMILHPENGQRLLFMRSPASTSPRRNGSTSICGPPGPIG